MRTVVGVFSDNDTVSRLAHDLKSSGFDLGGLIVISSDEPSGHLASSGARFVSDLEPTRIFGDVDTHVPGLRAKEPYEYGNETSPALEALSDLAVPDGRTDDYINAVKAGRSVVGYAVDDPADLRARFASAGGNPVSVFGG